MSNDKVRVSIEREKGGDRFRGEVLEIVKRNITRAMGQFTEKSPGVGILQDKSFGWGDDLKVTVPPGMKVKKGELVVAQIETYPESARGFTGKIIAVIGDAADPMNDSVRMLHAHAIPHEFSPATLKEAEAIPTEVFPSEWADRKDLRNIAIITIDGKTAKDFDDAVFTENTPQGFHLIVAIADVSHYVKPGSAIDDDAYLRGTSTYYPNFVSPMLPEKLSNELCSLKPKVPRLALVADMQFDFQGQLLSSEFYEAVIQSAARVTYGEAQEVVDGRIPPELNHVATNILRCSDLAKILMAKRFREGSLDLELPETMIEVDETGMPVDIMQSERLFAHRLIEELMLMANVAVARYFQKNEIEAIYRVHEPPVGDAINNFNNFLKAFGYTESVIGSGMQRKISKALEFFKGHPKSHIVNMLALRSLTQAKYQSNNVGHFGLGFADYTHFTSPIRRYPDLIVHRLLKASLVPEKGYPFMSLEDLDTAGTVLSACEQRSVKSERQIHSIKKARFMQQFIGEELEGVINSVTRFGIFVLLRKFDVDGLVRLEDLGGDRYEFDEENLCLVGKKTGMVFEIGDPIKIQVAKADHELGQIDFVLAEDYKHVNSQPVIAKGRREETRREEGRRDERGRDERPRKSFKPERQAKGGRPGKPSKTKGKRGGPSKKQERNRGAKVETNAGTERKFETRDDRDNRKVRDEREGRRGARPNAVRPGGRQTQGLNRFLKSTPGDEETVKRPDAKKKPFSARDLFTSRLSSKNKKK